MVALAHHHFLRRRVLPGFGLSFGVTMFYVSILVLLPLGTLFAQAAHLSIGEWLALLGNSRVAAAFEVSFGISFAAALVNGAIGLLIGWVLVRYRFPGRRLIDALIDLPFALPTAIAGIALSALYADNGWFGALFDLIGVPVAFTRLGIFVALLFVGLPFVVRSVQPVLADLEREPEEAALTLGAGRVVFPALAPAILTGIGMAFARGIGEYGSVIFIAGNVPGVSEIVPVLIVARLEQFDYAGSAALATAMLAASFAALVIVNRLQAMTRHRYGD